jgi:hypothetical protein
MSTPDFGRAASFDRSRLAEMVQGPSEGFLCHGALGPIRRGTWLARLISAGRSVPYPVASSSPASMRSAVVKPSVKVS